MGEWSRKSFCLSLLVLTIACWLSRAASAKVARDGTPVASTGASIRSLNVTLSTTSGSNDTYVVVLSGHSPNRTWTPPSGFTQPTACLQNTAAPPTVVFTSNTATSGATVAFGVSGTAWTISAGAYAFSGTNGTIDQCRMVNNAPASRTATSPRLTALTNAADMLMMVYRTAARAADFSWGIAEPFLAPHSASRAAVSRPACGDSRLLRGLAARERGTAPVRSKRTAQGGNV
jgi:hypothetical protein